MGELMMMDSEKYYRNLTEKELRILIRANDDKALDEFLRRCDKGEIKRKTYTLEEFEKMAEEYRVKRELKIKKKAS